MNPDYPLTYTRFLFSHIYVLESLPEGHLRTGTNLFESVLAPAQHNHTGPKAFLHSAPNVQAFTTHLRNIAQAALAEGILPLIHIDAHGDTEGLQLADGSVLGWAHLAHELLAINIACRMNLVVVASMCKGWFLMNGVLPSGRSPLFAVVGPPDAILAGTLENAMKRFYTEAVKGTPDGSDGDLGQALAAMNAGRPFDEWTIKPGFAEILFCRAFRTFWAGDGVATILRDRENSEVAMLTRFHRATPLQAAEIRHSVRARIRNPRYWYNELRRTFLMIDLFPENEARFGLSYDLCMPAT